jgi:hypothetical protein
MKKKTSLLMGLVFLILFAGIGIYFQYQRGEGLLQLEMHERFKEPMAHLMDKAQSLASAVRQKLPDAQNEISTAETQKEVSPPDEELSRDERDLIQWTWASIESGEFDRSPEVDTKLAQLSAGVKKAFREKYFSLAPESLNYRGSLVFLLGRTAETEADFDFLEKVAQEPVCQSVENCAQSRSEPMTNTEAHRSAASGDETTRRYPQMMAILQLQKAKNIGKLEELVRTLKDEILRTKAQKALDALRAEG